MQYKISMYYDDYIQYHDQIIAKDLSTQSNSIIFYTNKDTINFLNINNINYVIESNIKDKIKNILIFKKFILFSLIILIFCVYINTYRVQNITFNIDTPVNDIIREKIEVSNKKLFFFDFSKIDYQELSKELRSEYPCYEWISVEKKYDVIEVVIIKTGLDNQYYDNYYGDIVATTDAIVNSYVVHSGDILVFKNDYVKQGDILIQGSYYGIDITPKGYVLGHTFEEYTFNIDKVINSKELTGVSDSFYRIDFLNNIFNLSENKYPDYDEDEKTIFKFPFLFSISKVIHYEKTDNTYYNDFDSAKEYGITLVESSFNQEKVLDDEVIENCLILKCNEFDNYYEITYLVKKLESIGKLVIK